MITVAITCDEQTPVGACRGVRYAAVPTARQARAQARAEGWTTTPNGRDRCPTCTTRAAR